MYLSESHMAGAKAMRGWVVAERLKPGKEERKTAGGIVLPQDDKIQGTRMQLARIVSCGAYYHAQSGDSDDDNIQLIDNVLVDVRDPDTAWPLKPGTLILYHPHNPWEPLMEDGNTKRQFIVMKSIDVMAVLPEGEDE